MPDGTVTWLSALARRLVGTKLCLTKKWLTRILAIIFDGNLYLPRADIRESTAVFPATQWACPGFYHHEVFLIRTPPGSSSRVESTTVPSRDLQAALEDRLFFAGLINPPPLSVPAPVPPAFLVGRLTPS